jgi:hypothetical protein
VRHEYIRNYDFFELKKNTRSARNTLPAAPSHALRVTKTGALRVAFFLVVAVEDRYILLAI